MENPEVLLHYRYKHTAESITTSGILIIITAEYLLSSLWVVFVTFVGKRELQYRRQLKNQGGCVWSVEETGKGDSEEIDRRDTSIIVGGVQHNTIMIASSTKQKQYEKPSSWSSSSTMLLATSTSTTNDENGSGGGRIPLSALENIVVGSAAGALETCIQMPLITYKFCSQEGRRLPTSIPEWYRGLLVQAGTVAPITAFQFCANGLLQMMVVRFDNIRGSPSSPSSGVQRELTDSEMILTAAGAGSISALLYSPVDLITIHQQKLRMGMIETGQHIIQEYGWGKNGFYRGFFPCMIREAVYVSGYLGLAPVLTSHLLVQSSTDTIHNESSSIIIRSPFVAGILGASMAGVFSALVTHPIDTAKTCIQSDFSGKIWPNLSTTVPKLIKTSGVSSLFRGFLSRTTNICVACFICMNAQEMAIEYKNR